MINIWDILYEMIIGPLELLFEFIFSKAFYITNNPVLAIVVLSVCVNTLALPLYKRADKFQSNQSEIEKKLKKGVDHIKKTFKGDERYMILQTYYKQNNYKPYDILKSLLPLMLQIPFFMAAYNFLSNLEVLKGVSFGPIVNLSLPDQLLNIGSFTINLLPVLMTAINIVSSSIYTRGKSFKDKFQLYLVAAVFLFYLYDSPSGLVFYWTLNNLYSLLKNVVLYLLKGKVDLSKIIYPLLGTAGLLISVFCFEGFSLKRVFVLSVSLFMYVLLFLKSKTSAFEKIDNCIESLKINHSLFLLSALYNAIFIGFFTTSSLINLSAAEFVSSETMKNPNVYVLNSLVVSLGLFVVWFLVFYLLGTDKAKRILTFINVLIASSFTINSILFGRRYGQMSTSLVYDNGLNVTRKEEILNILVLLIGSLIVIYFYKKLQKTTVFIFGVLLLSVTVVSLKNVYDINNVSKEVLAKYEQSMQEQIEMPLSTDGKNVVVIMLDRAIGMYFPYIINEDNTILKEYEGFTYYPNTISFGGYTNVALPSLVGGYEYTPYENNKRGQESLVSKHNEALKVMPVLFDNNDYNVTVVDPSYANYEQVPDLSIYDDYPNINTYISEAKYNLDGIQFYGHDVLNRNLICYSIFRAFPVVLHKTMYDSGFYNSVDSKQGLDLLTSTAHKQTVIDNSTARGIDVHFAKAYAILANMKTMSQVKDDANNNFFMIMNNAAHSPTMLAEPEYELSYSIDNSEYDSVHQIRKSITGDEMALSTEEQITHYHSNFASIKILGKWFDYLRENNVWDNTRIIIVSDHGYPIAQDENLISEDGFDFMSYHPLLLFKDFNSNEFTIDNELMTNADVPTLATKDIIENPVNPFTGNIISSDYKENNPLYVLETDWNIATNNGNTYSIYNWYSVKDDSNLVENWENIDSIN